MQELDFSHLKMTFWLDDPDEVIHKFIGDKETARQVHLVAVFSGAQLFSK